MISTHRCGSCRFERRSSLARTCFRGLRGHVGGGRVSVLAGSPLRRLLAMSELELRDEIEDLLAELGQLLGPVGLLAYVERLAERIRDEIPEGSDDE
jgi:hypothetical protein